MMETTRQRNLRALVNQWGGGEALARSPQHDRWSCVSPWCFWSSRLSTW